MAKTHSKFYYQTRKGGGGGVTLHDPDEIFTGEIYMLQGAAGIRIRRRHGKCF